MVRTACLPLLMVGGEFTFLDIMSAAQLETFIPYMMKYARETHTKLPPEWWSRKLPYSKPLSKPEGMSERDYAAELRRIVTDCYIYHKLGCILGFCQNVVLDRDSIVKADNKDNTTSFFSSKERQHIVTITNENLFYDAVPARRETAGRSPRRNLLPPRPTPSIVYLCDNCDNEFPSEPAIAAHERVCYGGGDTQNEQAIAADTDLLGYLKLVKSSVAGPSGCQSNLSLQSNRFIELTSNRGRRILEGGKVKRVTAQKAEKLVQQYEAYCFVSPRSGKREFCVRKNYRAATYAAAESRPYCFSRSERDERYRTLKTGLNKRGRRLKVKCKKCYVVLERIVIKTAEPPVITIDCDCNSPPPSESTETMTEQTGNGSLPLKAPSPIELLIEDEEEPDNVRSESEEPMTEQIGNGRLPPNAPSPILIGDDEVSDNAYSRPCPKSKKHNTLRELQETYSSVTVTLVSERVPETSAMNTCAGSVSPILVDLCSSDDE